MKKRILSAAFALATFKATALPLFNPAEPAILNQGILFNSCNLQPLCHFASLRAGFWGNYVFNRHLETTDNPLRSRDIDITKLYDSAGFLAINICNKADLFTTLGASHLYLNAAALVFDDFKDLGQRAEIDSKYDLSYSVGVKATLVDFDNFYFGFESQYFYTHPSISIVTLRERYDQSLSSGSWKYVEWQAGFALSYRIIDWLAPYVGIKYSKTKSYFNDLVVNFPQTGESLTLHNLKNIRSVGYAVGFSIIGCNRALLTLEGRFSDEKAFSINGQFRF